MKRIIAVLVLCIQIITPLVSETDTSATDDTTPAEYTDEEFSSWQKDLRRAEIIAFGALPFVTLMTSLGYDIYRYVDHNQREEYLPWPLKETETAVPLSEDEQKKILLLSIGISVGVAVFDFGYRTLRRKIRNSRLDKKNREAVQAIIIEEIDNQ